MTKTLDLGCGSNPSNHFNADEVYGIDIVDFGNPNIKVADLVIDPIPFNDNTFDYVTGFDFLEHIPRLLYNGRERKQPFIDIMSETWRVLKPNGIALFHTPAIPYPEAFQDPQHVNYITDKTVTYFCVPSYANDGVSFLNLGHLYGFKGMFDLQTQVRAYGRSDVLVWQLRAIKN